MNYIMVAGSKPIVIGRAGENDVTTVRFNINALFPHIQDPTFRLLHQRSKDVAPYPCTIDVRNGYVDWRISNIDVGRPGNGTAQLSAIRNGAVAKTMIFTTVTLDSMGVGEPPDPVQNWYDDVMYAGSQASDSAARASRYAQQAEAAAAEAESTIQNMQEVIDAALQAAKDSGDFKGDPPTIEIDTDVESWVDGDGHSNSRDVTDVSFTNAVGTYVAHVKDGWTPKLYASKSGDTTTVEIYTDEYASPTVLTIKDGEQGPAGSDFWATYGTTTSAEIEAAYQSEQGVWCVNTDRIYQLVFRDSSTCHTFATARNNVLYIAICDNNVWSTSYYTMAKLDSPTFTGTPKAPTAAAGTDTTQIATTEFVQNELDGVHQVPAGGGTDQVLAKNSGTDYDLKWVTPSGGGGTTEVFWATYNTTTFSEVSTAYAAEKICACTYSNDTYYLVHFESGVVAHFACVEGHYKSLYLYADDTWVPDSVNIGTYSKPSGGIPSTDLASAVQTSLGKADTAYQKPSGGIPATDLANGVIPSVPSAATATPANLGTAAVGTSTKYAREDHIHNKPSYTASEVGAIAAPSSPASGAFLVWNGSAWVAQTLSTWQASSY